MSIIHHQDLLSEIEAFLSETGMGESYFGKKAIGNSEVVKRLKGGGRIFSDTEEKLRIFMAANAPSSMLDREAS